MLYFSAKNQSSIFKDLRVLYLLLSLAAFVQSAAASPAPFGLKPLDNCTSRQESSIPCSELLQTSNDPALARHYNPQCSWQQRMQVVMKRLVPGSSSVPHPFHPQQSFLLALPKRAAVSLLQVTILEQNTANAFALAESESQAATIIVTRGLLQKINSINELAFVLAHEYAHIEEAHFPIAVPEILLNKAQLAHIEKVHIQWELLADRKALQRVQEANYDTTASLTLLSRLEKAFTPSERAHIRQHPSFSERLLALRENLGRSIVALLSAKTPAHSPDHEVQHARR